MELYCIANWDINYEVTDDNREWKPGKKFFVGPLRYVRAPSRRAWPCHLLEIRDQTDAERVFFILGIFERLCGIVACEPRTYREGGIIRNSEQKPATLHEIARMLRLPDATVAGVVAVLCDPDVAWMDVREGDDPAGASDNPQDSADSRKDPQDSADSRTKTLQVEVEVNTSQEEVESRDTTHSQEKPHIVRLDPDISDRGHDLDPRQDVRCFQIVNRTLAPPTGQDVTALTNFIQWIHRNVASGRAGPNTYNEVVTVAEDCLNGENPMAVFMARVKEKWDYQPPSKKARHG